MPVSVLEKYSVMQTLNNSTYCNLKNNKILRDNVNKTPKLSLLIKVYLNGDSIFLDWKISEGDNGGSHETKPFNPLSSCKHHRALFRTTAENLNFIRKPEGQATPQCLEKTKVEWLGSSISQLLPELWE